MRPTRCTHVLTAWIAILAIVLAALAPTVSRALAAQQGATWTEICSAQGSRWVRDTDTAKPGLPDAAHAMEHCPYCSLQGEMPALPSPSPGALAVTASDAVPAAFLSAPRTLHAWASAQPRAPPQAS